MNELGRVVYNPGASARNVDAEGRLEALLAEPFPCQMGAGLRRATEPLDERRRPLRLRDERRERRSRGLRPDRVARQVGANPGVAVPAPRQRPRSRGGEPLIVDVADALERLERLETVVVVEARPREAVLDLSPRPVPMLERPCRDLDRVAFRHA